MRSVPEAQDFLVGGISLLLSSEVVSRGRFREVSGTAKVTFFDVEEAGFSDAVVVVALVAGVVDFFCWVGDFLPFSTIVDFVSVADAVAGSMTAEI